MAKLMGLGSGNNQIVSSYKELYLAASSNTGNLLFNFALELLIDLAGTDVRWSTPAEKINNDGHALLIPMANNIGKHMDLARSGPKLSNVSVPVTVMGLGAQFPLNASFQEGFDAIPDTSKNWLKELCNRSNIPNVSVRGKLTHQVFEALGIGEKAVVLGCPSHFLSSDKSLGSTLSKKSESLSVESLYNGVAVTAGNPSIANLTKLEQYLIKLINEYGGRYIVQHPENLICLSEHWLNDISEQDTELVRERFFPSFTTSEMLRWLRKFSATYVSIPQWYSDISKSELAVGTRIHGCQLALQSAVPAVCLHIDSRTKELCETMCIPTISAREFQLDPNVDKLIELLNRWNWQQYDENRISLAKQTYDFVELNGLQPSRHFKNLIN